MRPSFQEMADKYDLDKAVRLRGEYGRVKWLVSWHMLNDDEWIARISTPTLDETLEGSGKSRCMAIDDATRKTLDALHQNGKSSLETA